MTQSLLIKYAEIGIKGKNRYLFENALVKQAKIALKRVDGEFVVTKEAGRIYVTTESDCDMDEAIEALCVWYCRHLPNDADRGQWIWRFS